MTDTPRTRDRSIDGARSIETLVAAFAADPVMRWLFPDDLAYEKHFAELLRVFGAEGPLEALLDCTAALEGAAIWHPPGVSYDEEALGELLGNSIDESRLDDVGAFAGQLDEHHPTFTHWYLPFIGVDPAHQGSGHGSALLAVGLERADRDRLPAYLEASTPRNRALYERHGFEALAEIQVADSPPLWPMLRTAR